MTNTILHSCNQQYKKPHWKAVPILSIFIYTCIINYYWYEKYRAQPTKSSLSSKIKRPLAISAIDYDVSQAICNETNDIVKAVYNRGKANESEALLWEHDAPFKVLDCEQLIRSIPNGFHPNYDNYTGAEKKFDLSVLRLAEKVDKKMNNLMDRPLRIVAFGGSMSTGLSDFSAAGFNIMPERAWARKLELFMHEKWGTQFVEVINLSQSGAGEDTWIEQIDIIVSELPIDVVLVESAVNDQCSWYKQDKMIEKVNTLSTKLLNLLVNLPSKPAVFSVELFRTAFQNKNDIMRDCPNNGGTAEDNQLCMFCPQWWKPQTWRVKARERNSVSAISYRDAVWPILDQPPQNLCSQYWFGSSHPQALTHAYVGSTIFFQILNVIHFREDLLNLLENNIRAIPLLPSAKNTSCLEPLSAYHARQGDPHDPMFPYDNENNRNNGNSSDVCWEFKGESKERYGWICEYDKNKISQNLGLPSQSYFQLSKSIKINANGKMILSRLVSWDKKMAKAQVWLSTNRMSSTNSSLHENVFVGNPVWTISSWHDDWRSIPKAEVIHIDGLELKAPLQNLVSTKDLSSDSKSKIPSYPPHLEVLLNIKLIVGSSPASLEESLTGVDKFKLMGIVTC